MVNVLQKYIGTIAYPVQEITILNSVKSALNALLYTGGSSNGVLSSWDSSSLVLTYNGPTQTASITVSVQLVGQNRYITVFATVLPLSFSVTATS